MKIKNTTITKTIALCAIVFLLNLSGLIGSFASLGQLSVLGAVNRIVNLAEYVFPLWLIFALAKRQNREPDAPCDNKKVGTVLIVLAVMSFYQAVMAVVSFFMMGGFQQYGDIYFLVVYSPLYTMLLNLFEGVLLLKVGKAAAKNEAPQKFNRLFYLFFAVLCFYLLLLVTVNELRFDYAIDLLPLFIVWMLPAELLGAPVKKGSGKIVLVIAAFLVLCALIANGGGGGSSHDSRYDEVFGKDPNEWTEEDKRYVNDLFEFIDENNKK